MPSHTSTRSFESTSVPGVTVRLKKSNEKRRAELMRNLAPLLEKERLLLRSFAEIQERAVPSFDEQGKPVMDPDTCEQVKNFANTEDATAAGQIVQDLEVFRTLEVYPVYLRWGLSGIEDLDIDGRPATIQDLLSDDAPDGLVKEILDVLQEKVDLPAEKKSD